MKSSYRSSSPPLQMKAAVEFIEIKEKSDSCKDLGNGE